MKKRRALINISIQVVATALVLLGLYLVSHGANVWQNIIGVLLFAFFNNTLFSLMHESVHKIYSKNLFVNETMGIMAAAFFPSGLMFQRLCHMSHHCNNRTDHEIFDQYYPNDNILFKRFQFFGIFTGLYWIMIICGWMIYLVFPGFANLIAKLGNKSRFLKHADVAILLPFGRTKYKNRIRLELLFTVIVQLAIFKFLSLTFLAWFFSYLAFSLLWGSLQYADHAFSPRDIKKGAWDLEVNPFIRFIFLNYNHHRAHHTNPTVPWFELGEYVDKKNPRPHFWKIYLKMWQGPVPVTEPEPPSLTDEEVNSIFKNI